MAFYGILCLNHYRTGLYLTDEDVHKCGRCGEEFSALDVFIQHKLSRICRRPLQDPQVRFFYAPVYPVTQLLLILHKAERVESKMVMLFRLVCVYVGQSCDLVDLLLLR